VTPECVDIVKRAQLSMISLREVYCQLFVIDTSKLLNTNTSVWHWSMTWDVALQCNVIRRVDYQYMMMMMMILAETWFLWAFQHQMLLLLTWRRHRRKLYFIDTLSTSAVKRTDRQTDRQTDSDDNNTVTHRREWILWKSHLTTHDTTILQRPVNVIYRGEWGRCLPD